MLTTLERINELERKHWNANDLIRTNVCVTAAQTAGTVGVTWVSAVCLGRITYCTDSRPQTHARGAHRHWVQVTVGIYEVSTLFYTTYRFACNPEVGLNSPYPAVLILQRPDFQVSQNCFFGDTVFCVSA